MFFYLSKLFWLVAAPVNFLLILLALGMALTWTRHFVAGRRLQLSAGLMLLVGGFSPLGPILLHILEERIPQASVSLPEPVGIIVLGGGIDESLTFKRHSVALTEAGARMTEAVALARRFPQAKLVFSGGSAALLGKEVSESDAARLMWTQLGVAPERMLFDDKSRNTSENANNVQQLLKPRANDTWFLVTSAFHMPRSLGIFRKIGFDVTPYPVDYRTHPWPGGLRPDAGALHNLLALDWACREWIGLVAYYASGRTSALFPAP